MEADSPFPMTQVSATNCELTTRATPELGDVRESRPLSSPVSWKKYQKGY